MWKSTASTMKELPPFGAGIADANRHQSKSGGMLVGVCPVGHGPKNTPFASSYGFDLHTKAFEAERPSSADRMALVVVPPRATQVEMRGASSLAPAPKAVARDPRLRTYVVVQLQVGEHGVTFGELEGEGKATVKRALFADNVEGEPGEASGEAAGEEGGEGGEGGGEAAAAEMGADAKEEAGAEEARAEGGGAAGEGGGEAEGEGGDEGGGEGGGEGGYEGGGEGGGEGQGQGGGETPRVRLGLRTVVRDRAEPAPTAEEVRAEEEARAAAKRLASESSLSRMTNASSVSRLSHASLPTRSKANRATNPDRPPQRGEDAYSAAAARKQAEWKGRLRRAHLTSFKGSPSFLARSIDPLDLAKKTPARTDHVFSQVHSPPILPDLHRPPPLTSRSHLLRPSQRAAAASHARRKEHAAHLSTVDAVHSAAAAAGAAHLLGPDGVAAFPPPPAAHPGVGVLPTVSLPPTPAQHRKATRAEVPPPLPPPPSPRIPASALRRRLRCTSAAPPLHLGCISARSPSRLGCPSPPRCPRCTRPTRPSPPRNARCRSRRAPSPTRRSRACGRAASGWWQRRTTTTNGACAITSGWSRTWLRCCPPRRRWLTAAAAPSTPA